MSGQGKIKEIQKINLKRDKYAPKYTDYNRE